MVYEITLTHAHIMDISSSSAPAFFNSSSINCSGDLSAGILIFDFSYTFT